MQGIPMSNYILAYGNKHFHFRNKDIPYQYLFYVKV